MKHPLFIGGKILELSLRIGMMFSWLDRSERVTDIGTDHGLLPIFLARHGFTGIIAADLRKQPLDRARENAKKYAVENIDFRLSDGLEKICPDETDAVVIAGLSGETIISIIEKAPWLKSKKLILQPMSRPWILRMFLSGNGYAIIKEEQVFEDGRFFIIMLVRVGIISFRSLKFMPDPPFT
jgi:tRNA (adenine22-N1)-methyltransferase